MKPCLLNWVEAGGKTHNGAPVKMNENKGTQGPRPAILKRRAAQSREKSLQWRRSCAADRMGLWFGDPLAITVSPRTDPFAQTSGTRIIRKGGIGIVLIFP